MNLNASVILFLALVACATSNPSRMPNGYPNSETTKHTRFGFAQLYLGGDAQFAGGVALRRACCRTLGFKSIHDDPIKKGAGARPWAPFLKDTENPSGLIK